MNMSEQKLNDLTGSPEDSDDTLHEEVGGMFLQWLVKCSFLDKSLRALLIKLICPFLVQCWKMFC